jgi:photosystem II 13kDa protein
MLRYLKKLSNTFFYKIPLMAQIEFSRGITESVVPDVRLTRSTNGGFPGRAMFVFNEPDILGNDVTAEITGMYMIDEEGEITSRDVNAKFVNGKPQALEVTYVMNDLAEWDRFMRFMNRYAESNGLGFTKS